jgi:exonuclease SbcD
LQDEYGEINFWLLPFVRPSTVRSYFPDSQIETFTEAIATIMQSAAFDEKKRNVLISHQFYVSSGVIPVRSESEIEPIGGLDAVDTECLLPFDYVALGHLHGSQKIGSEAIRYAGSPLKYSFSESKQKKGINLVEMGEKGQISIRQLPILPMHDMREIRGRFEEILSEEFSSAQNKNDYLKITLLDDEEIIDPMERIRKVYPFAMVLAFDNKKTQINLSEVAADAETQESLSTFELFADFFLKTTGQVMSQEQSEVVKALLGQEEEE